MSIKIADKYNHYFDITRHFIFTLIYKFEWYKDEQNKAFVRDAISKELDENLPRSYDTDTFNSKTNLPLNRCMERRQDRRLPYRQKDFPCIDFLKI